VTGDAAAWAALEREVIGCRRCPRLVAWREEVGRTRVRRYADEEYWARPVPGFGDPAARVLVLGLAPAAHGGNRTGRVFTGDRSGDFLWSGLHRVGWASAPVSRARDDGLELHGCYVTAAVRCAPPQNRPRPVERDACAPFLARELALLGELRVVVCLGAFGWDAGWRALDPRRRPRPRFGHGAEAEAGGLALIGCFHPSQQNTFTGKLTPAMLDDVLARARTLSEKR
jgi:uracil-DNA glycosylase family 4